MSRDNSAQRMTTSPHEQALLLDGVAGRPAVAHNGWPNGQKTVDAETLSGNCCGMPRQRVGGKVHEHRMCCSCTLELYEPYRRAFSPHLSRGYDD